MLEKHVLCAKTKLTEGKRGISSQMSHSDSHMLCHGIFYSLFLYS